MAHSSKNQDIIKDDWKAELGFILTIAGVVMVLLIVASVLSGGG